MENTSFGSIQKLTSLDYMLYNSQNSFSSTGHQRQLSYPFLQPNHFNVASASIFKKTNIKKISLHQLKIESQDLCQQDQEQQRKQKGLINCLKQDQLSQSDQDIKSTNKQFYKRQIKAFSQTKNKAQFQMRQNCNSLFNQGFLPQVQKFYKTFKNLDRQKDKLNLLRHTFHESESKKQNFNPIKLASNIKQVGIIPKKLGIVGRHSLHKVDQNNAHLTKRQMKTLAKGLTLLNVKKLGLSNNTISKQNAKSLFDNLPQRLQKINLKSTIKNRGVLLCMNSQKLKTGKLKKLNLSENKITDTGLSCIQQVLKCNLSLQILNLSSNLITDVSAQLLGNFIQSGNSLRNMNLSWNKISGKQIFYLFDSIANSNSLLNVNLSRNHIGDYLNDPIIIKNLSKKKIQNNSLSNSSLKSLCGFLKLNKYVIHLDMSFNKICSEDCQQIADVFNIFNQSLVRFHFQGNSNYKTNFLGYLISQKINKFTEKTNINSKLSLYDEQNLARNPNQILKNQNHSRNSSTILPKTFLFKKIDFKNMSEQQQLNFLKQRRNLFNQTNIKHNLKLKTLQNQGILSEQCWMCNQWVTKKFIFQISKKKLETLDALQSELFTTFQTKQKNIKSIYIHLQCYNYQPLLMKWKKKNKTNLKNICFEDEETFKAEKKQNSKAKTIIRVNNDADTPKKSLQSYNTLTYCDNLSTNTLNGYEQKQQIYNFSLNLKTPIHKKFKYFFTIDGQIFLDDKSPKITLKNQSKRIKFQTFNPFRQVLLGKINELMKNPQMKEVKNGQIMQKIKNLLKQFPSSMQMNLQSQSLPSNYSLNLQQINISIPDQLCNNLQNLIEKQKKIHKVYEKLIEGKQQLTSEEYQALIVQKSQILNSQQQGSDKYISTQKLIEDNQLINYSQENQNSQIFLKPRNKNLLFGSSDAKSNSKQFNFQECFKALLNFLLQKSNSSQISSTYFSQFQSFLDQTIKSLKTNYKEKHQNSQLGFYPSKVELNQKNIYLNVGQSIKYYNKDKIKINNFTGQIVKIGKFDKQITQKTEKSLNGDNDYQENKNLINYQLRTKLSLIAPYVLIQYNMLKQEDTIENPLKIIKKEDIFFKIEEKRKQMKKESKIRNKKSKLSILNQNSTNPQYLIKIVTPLNQKITLQNSLPTSNNDFLSLDLKQSNLDDNISAISIRLVQEILKPKSDGQSNANLSKKSSENNVQQISQTNSSLVQKLQNWKTYNNLMDIGPQQKNVLKLVNQQLSSNIEKKTISTLTFKNNFPKKTNKFNLKINKFCSLQATSLQASDLAPLVSLIASKKRPTFNIDQNRQNFSMQKKKAKFDVEDKQLQFDDQSMNYQQNANNSKIKSLQQKLSSINLSKQIELFFIYDRIFDKTFIQLNLENSIETYIKKINKILNKKQLKVKAKKPIQNQTNNKKQVNQANKDSNQTPLKQKTKRDIRKGTSKSIVKRLTKRDQKDLRVFQQTEQNINKNIFMFLMQERQNSSMYFSDDKNKHKNLSFIQNNVQLKETNLVQRIFNRFDYINLNLIKNLTNSKILSTPIPSGAKQVLLKELCLFRSFLFNSSALNYSQNIKKLIEILKSQKQKTNSCSSQFLSKVKKFSFLKVIDLIEQHLLYTIFLLTKHTTFLTLLNKFKILSQKNSQQDNLNITISNQKTSTNKSNLQNQSKQLRKSKDIPIQILNSSPGQNDNQCKSNKKSSASLLQFIKNQPQKFQQQLQKLSKSIFSQILSLITKLHIKYDQNVDKMIKKSKQTSKSSNKIIKSREDISDDPIQQKVRVSSFFSNNSSKRVSMQKQTPQKNLQAIIKKDKTTNKIQEINKKKKLSLTRQRKLK